MIEKRKSERRSKARTPATVDAVLAVDTVVADSKRLVAEIDVLLEHSHDLMKRQSLIHRAWRR